MKKFIIIITVALTVLLTACTRQMPTEVRENTAEKETEELVFIDTPFDGIIPKIQIDGKEVPLGEALPPSEIAYDPADPEEMPLFLYTHPENWEEEYRAKGTNRYIAHVGEYYMEVSIWGPVGPVWKFTSYSGVLCGVTDHTFLFDEDGEVLAVEQGSETLCTHLFEKLPLAERTSRKDLGLEASVNLEENVQINSLYDVDYTVVDGTGIWVEMPEATVSKPEMVRIYEKDSVRWYQYRDGRMFFVQKYYGFSPYEAVFYGGINGCMQILHIPFDGEFRRADAYGITYERDGDLYFKPFYRVGINGEMNYIEIPACLRAWGLELPKEIMGDSLEDSIEAEMVPPFLIPEK